MTKRTYLYMGLIALLLLCIHAQALAAGSPVANAPNEICPVLIGTPFPDITLKDLEGNPFDLNHAITEKPTVLIYFRGGW